MLIFILYQNISKPDCDEFTYMLYMSFKNGSKPYQNLQIGV